MRLIVERDHSSECQQTVSSFKDEDIEEFGEELPPNALDETTDKPTLTIDGHTYSRKKRSRIFVCSCSFVFLALNTAQTHYMITRGEHSTVCGLGRGSKALRLHADFDNDGVDIDESALQPSKDDVRTIIYDNRPFKRQNARYLCPCRAVTLVLNDDKTRVVVQGVKGKSHKPLCSRKWRNAH